MRIVVLPHAMEAWRRGEIVEIEGFDPDSLDLMDWFAEETNRLGYARVHGDDLDLKSGQFTVREHIEGLQVLDLVEVLQ